jgi:hypothetical protein
MKALLLAAIVYVNGTPIEIPEGYTLDFKLIPYCQTHPNDIKCNPPQCAIYDNCPTDPTCQDGPQYCTDEERCEVWPQDDKCITQPSPWPPVEPDCEDIYPESKCRRQQSGWD